MDEFYNQIWLYWWAKSQIWLYWFGYMANTKQKLVMNDPMHCSICKSTGITFGEASILKISVELYATLFVSKKLNRRQV